MKDLIETLSGIIDARQNTLGDNPEMKNAGEFQAYSHGLEYALGMLIGADTTEAEAHDYGAYELIPLRTSGKTLRRLTDAQLDRALKLAKDFGASTIRLQADDWGSENVLFALRDSTGDGLHNGLIEPDGRCHT